MSKAITNKLKAGIRIHWVWDYYMLFKFRLSLMVVISSVLAYLIAAGMSFSWLVFTMLFLGGMAITAAANGINQVLEKDYDALMVRTRLRPLADNRMRPTDAVMVSGLLLVFGICCLAVINPLCVFLGMLSFILYAFVYTPLKRHSSLAVAVGAIPGALPTLIGVVANDGTITLFGLTVFFIQFLWQFPHFWAISFLSFDDYVNAGFKLLPRNADGKIDRNLGLYSTLYSMLIIPTVLWAYFNGLDTHIVSLVLIIAVTLGYSFFGLKLQLSPTKKSALNLMLSSFFYLPIVLILYLIG